MKLNLGSGKNPLEGYCNIDRCYDYTEETAFGAEGPHTVRGEVYPLFEGLADRDVTEIRASHVLEHLGWRETMNAIQDWVRVLKPGGILKIAVPNFEWICRQYLAEIGGAERDPKLTMYLMGSQTDENDYHKAIFDANGLKDGMELAGLVDVGQWTSEIEDCASLPVSLNLMGTKPGRKQQFARDGSCLHRNCEWGDKHLYLQCCDCGMRQYGDLSDFEPPPKEEKETITVSDVAVSEENTASPHPYAWINDRCYNKYSQWGEDGMLQAIFERIGTTNRYVIECGAGHPVRGSNSRKLIEEGWNALLIESDLAKCDLLWKEYGKNANVVIRNETVSGTGFHDNTMDAICAREDVPQSPDLLVIDIDGQDWYLWNNTIRLYPRVVVIEFGHNDDPHFIPEVDGDGQAGYAAIEALACYKGYRPIVRNGYNLICVRQSDAEILDNPIKRNDLRDITGEHPDHISHFMAEPATIKDEYLSEPTEKPGTLLFKPEEIGAMMSCPRLGFMDNMFSCYAIAATGIHLERSGGAFWDQGLTRLMENGLAADRKYLLTLDYDSVFVAQDVIELYRIMATPGNEHIDALAAMQIRREKEGVLLTVADESGKNRHEILSTELETNALPIRTGHFGLTMIRASSLRRMPKPWFMPVPDENGEWGDGRRDSDVNFWCHWHACGNTLFAAPRVVIGHTEQVISWPDRHLKTFRQGMSDYQKTGKPDEAWK